MQDYPKLKTFLETLDPFAGYQEKDITDYLWTKVKKKYNESRLEVPITIFHSIDFAAKLPL